MSMMKQQGCMDDDTMNIPIFRRKFDKEEIDGYKMIADDILTNNEPLSDGKYCRMFEKRFSEYINSDFAISTTNGTTALEIALRAVDVKGKYVCISDNTMVAQALAVERAGGIPVPLDIELDTFSMDYHELESVISKSKEVGKNLGAVILTYIGGLIPENIDEFISLLQLRDIPLIEDSCHAIGSHREFMYLRESHVTTYTAGGNGIGCFSFYPTKMMTTGEGGMITTDDENLYDKMKQIKRFGWKEQGITETDGLNGKMSELQAGLGIMEMNYLDKRIKRRKEITEYYIDNLDDMYIVSTHKGCSHYKTIVTWEDPYIMKDEINQRCIKNGVNLTGEVYSPLIHQQPLYNKRYDPKYYKNAIWFSENHICPPNYDDLFDDEVEYVVKVLNGEIK